MSSSFLNLITKLYVAGPWDENLAEPLKNFGFENPQKAWKNLTILAAQAKFAELLPEFFPNLLQQISGCYNPDMALHNLERFAEKINDKEYLYTLLASSRNLLNALITLFSGSQALTDALMSDPSHFDWMNQPDILEKSRNKDAMMRDFYSMAGEHYASEKTPALLRKFKKQEYIRIGLRDLMGKTDFRETGADLANLADVCLQVACEYADAQCTKKYGVPMYQDADDNLRKAEFSILGMGKLGGGELNYSSDIDLIYIYTSSRGETRTENPGSASFRISNHEYFTKLALLVTKTIHEITSEGNVFRVDLNLRPEGQSGEIVNSLASCEVYYQSWGRTWERQALLKARVSAGSESLGKEFFDLMEPFVYRRSLDFSVIDEIRAMKQKINQSLKGVKTAHIKLGVGGIREIEFIVQTYQLLFAGKDKSLRIKGTLPLLDALREKGFISPEDSRSLAEAYVFLRNLENRVQISYGLQTHVLPDDPKQLTILAKKMRIEEDGQEPLAERLLREFGEQTRFVNKVFESLLAEEEKQEAAKVVAGRTAVLDKKTFNKNLLEGIPFSDPERALRFLKSLRDGPSFSHPSEKSIQEFYAVLPTILELCRQAPRPNQSVENLVRFVESGGARETYLNLFQDNKKFLELLLILFGSSEFLSETLIKQPGMVDVVMDTESIYRFTSPEKISGELARSLNSCRNLEEKKIALCRFKQGEELRIGLRYLISESDLVGTLADLSNLADIFLKAVYETALQELGDRAGGAVLNDFAIIGMGKLGGRELNFGSDLDVVFVYEEPFSAKAGGSQEDVLSHYVSLTQMVYQLASEMTTAGYAYKIDADLRPEGSRGLLVLSMGGYEEYFRSRARIWEKQAMTRARFVAGNPQLGSKFIKAAHDFVFGEPLEYSSLIEISRLRERMEKELAREASRGKNVKLGYGGLADIEFSVQILQMMHGRQYPRLRDTNTRAILQALAGHGLIDHHAAEKLEESYLFLRNLECALRVLIQPFTSHIPAETFREQLAGLLGYKGESGEDRAGKMMAKYEAVTGEVRTFYSRLVGALLRKSL